MTPNQAARALLEQLSLPYGTVTILPWHEDGHVVMHVMVDRNHIRHAKIPPVFEGYRVVLEERQPATAYSLH